MILLAFKLSSLRLNFIQQIFTEHIYYMSGTVLDPGINAEQETQGSHLPGEEIVNTDW